MDTSTFKTIYISISSELLYCTRYFTAIHYKTIYSHSVSTPITLYIRPFWSLQGHKLSNSWTYLQIKPNLSTLHFITFLHVHHVEIFNNLSIPLDLSEDPDKDRESESSKCSVEQEQANSYVHLNAYHSYQQKTRIHLGERLHFPSHTTKYPCTWVLWPANFIYFQ